MPAVPAPIIMRSYICELLHVINKFRLTQAKHLSCFYLHKAVTMVTYLTILIICSINS